MNEAPETESQDSAVLKSMLENPDINQQDLARAMKTSRVAVNQVLNGKRGLTPTMALKLEAAVGLPALPLLQNQLIRDLNKAYEENKEVLEEIRRNPLLPASSEVN